MARKPLVASLDMGTSKSLAAVAEVEETGLRVVAVAGAAGGGVRRGAVVDIPAAVAAAATAAGRARRTGGLPLGPLMLGSAGGQLFSINARAELTFPEEAAALIGHSHVVEVLARARETPLPAGYQLVHVIPQGYLVDGYEGCMDPVGMAGHRLEANVHLVACQVGLLQNLWRVAEEAGLQIEDYAVAGLASAESVLTMEERREGVLLIDLGAGATQVVAVVEGEPALTAVIPLGGEHVTADIAAGLHLTRTQAERLKVRHACADPATVPEDRMVEIEADPLSESPQGGRAAVGEYRERELAEIAGARVEEILQAVVELTGKRGPLHFGAGAVLTGGGCRLRGIQGVAMRLLSMPVRAGGALGAGATLGAPECAAAVGLLQLQARRRTGGSRLLPLGGEPGRAWPPWRRLFGRVRAALS